MSLPKYKLSSITYNRLLSQLKCDDMETLFNEVNKLRDNDIFSIEEDKRLTFQAILDKKYELVTHILTNLRQQKFMEEFIAMSLNDPKMLDVVLQSPQMDKEESAMLYAFISIKMEDSSHLEKALKMSPKTQVYIDEKDIPENNKKYFKPKKQLVFETVSLLGYAIYSLNEGIIDKLLAHGMKPTEDDFLMILNFKDEYQEKALNLLNKKNKLKVSQKLYYDLLDGGYETICIELLKQNLIPTINKEKVFERAAENNSKQILEYLINEKIRLNFKTSILLQHASEHTNKTLAKYLLDQGAFIDEKVLDKCTSQFKNWLEKQPRYESLNINLDKDLKDTLANTKRVKI